MKYLEYQQTAVTDLIDKTIRLLNLGGNRNKLVFEAPTGSGKTVMACQMLAGLIDELHDRGCSRYQEAAFIWFAPRKLHLQSYEKIKGTFYETRTLRPVTFDELDQNEGIRPGEILFVNWESVNKESNVMVRERDSALSLYEITDKTKEEFGLPIIAIIDEEHMFWSKTADKSAAVLDRINPAVEIRISATPKTANPKEKVTVYRQDVIEAEMIKKEVVLNPDIELNFSSDLELNANLIKAALAKRNQIAQAYKEVNSNINPLVLIQLPNDTKENMTADDTAIAEQVKEYLRVMCDITTDNHRLAVWLANEKANLKGLEAPDNMTDVLLFKEAIALGWDCPRASVLLIFRKLESDQFTIQTVGRIMRMPEQKHYQKEILNSGYVFTDIAKDKIQIVTADADYILRNILTSHRRENLNNVSLPSSYSERPNIERNYLGPDFRQVLYDEARNFWGFVQGELLFSLEELASLSNDEDDKPLPDVEDPQINENRRKASKTTRLDVKNVNIPIPKDVHFVNEEQILEVGTMKYARKASEIDRVFMDYISKKGHQFESKGRTDKIASYLLEILTDSFGVFETDAKKIVLYHDNQRVFDRILNAALERYARLRAIAKRESASKRAFKEYLWEVPEERTYDGNTNEIAEAENHALEPFVRLKDASSNQERDFIEYLEENSQYIDWWYKNGDKGKQHFAVEYCFGENKSKAPFYVDFIIRMKNGHIYLFDTKSEDSDPFAPDKHNALLDYIKKNSTDEAPLFGGVIIHNSNNWMYSPTTIKNTHDTLKWDCFYPQNA